MYFDSDGYGERSCEIITLIMWYFLYRWLDVFASIETLWIIKTILNKDTMIIRFYTNLWSSCNLCVLFTICVCLLLDSVECNTCYLLKKVQTFSCSQSGKHSHQAIFQVIINLKGSSHKNENSDINYSPSCCSKSIKIFMRIIKKIICCFNLK